MLILTFLLGKRRMVATWAVWDACELYSQYDDNDIAEWKIRTEKGSSRFEEEFVSYFTTL